MNETKEWLPTSWKHKPRVQEAPYPDPAQARQAMATLAKLPPLVTSWEVETLKSELAEAARGQRFLLQGGDCCESFDDCRSDSITSKVKILLKMSFILLYGARRPVIRVGRFAGQYAKPRSAETETRDGVTLPTYRGDLIIGPILPQARRPTPGGCWRLQPGGADVELHPRADRRRLRRSAPPRILGHRFRATIRPTPTNIARSSRRSVRLRPLPGNGHRTNHWPN